MVRSVGHVVARCVALFIEGRLLGVNCMPSLWGGASCAHLCLVVLPAHMMLFLAGGGKKVNEEDENVEGEYEGDDFWVRKTC